MSESVYIVVQPVQPTTITNSNSPTIATRTQDELIQTAQPAQAIAQAIQSEDSVESEDYEVRESNPIDEDNNEGWVLLGGIVMCLALIGILVAGGIAIANLRPDYT